MKVLIEKLVTLNEGTDLAGRYELATVVVEIRGRHEVVNCKVYGNDIYLKGFVGRYRTSANPWLATVHLNKNNPEKVWVHFGRDDRSGRFNKSNMISYEPVTYAAELAKVRKENEEAAKARTIKRLAKEVVAKTKTVATSSATKYEYPEGLTAKQKQAFRAKARRAKA